MFCDVQCQQHPGIDRDACPPPQQPRWCAQLRERESLEAVAGGAAVLYTAERLCFQAGYQIVLGALTGATTNSQQVETKPFTRENHIEVAVLYHICCKMFVCRLS